MQRWILIADASDARIFSINGRDRSMKVVQELKHPSGRLRPQQIDTDQAGRFRKRMGARTKSAMDAQVDPHTTDMRRFAKTIGEVIQKAEDQHAFDALAIIAPPKFLGILRKQPAIRSTKCLLAHLAADYVDTPARDLPDYAGTALLGWFGNYKKRLPTRSGVA